MSVSRPLSHSIPVCLAVVPRGWDSQGYSNFLNAQAPELCSFLTKYNKTAQLHLRDKTSLCQCEGTATQ